MNALQQIIQRAFEEAIAQMCAVYVDNQISPSPIDREQAMERFRSGVALLKKCRQDLIEELKDEV